jgi:hypothetical protein
MLHKRDVALGGLKLIQGNVQGSVVVPARDNNGHTSTRRLTISAKQNVRKQMCVQYVKRHRVDVQHFSHRHGGGGIQNDEVLEQKHARELAGLGGGGSVRQVMAR